MRKPQIMRKYIITLLLTIAALSAQAANKAGKVYMFGFAASFNDSTVYFTDIQEVDSAYYDTKTKFLYGREDYSASLREHLQNQGFETPTCVTSFAFKRKDLEKKYAKMRKKYDASKYIVKEVKAPWFTYSAQKPEEFD